jgi:hypothetical protein
MKRRKPTLARKPKRLEGKRISWTEELDDGLSVWVQIMTKAGKLLQFTILLRRDAILIARYDCAHGFPHLDRLGKSAGKRVLQKVPCTQENLSQAFDRALDDICTNRLKHVMYFDRN